MKLSSFDLSRVLALHHLLEEAHVGRAAGLLGITPAAASNALRRLRADFADPLMVKKGRGLIRTRMGEELREPAREVIAAAGRLEQASRPFEPATFRGQLCIALAEHVATVLLPELDRLARAQAPQATLTIAPIPDRTNDWLERTGGLLVSPIGAFAATAEADGLVMTPIYEDRYVVAMRSDHPLTQRRWNLASYASLEHVLVVPRGRTARSDIDDQMAVVGLTRRIVRVVPSFTLALQLLAQSDLVTTMPELYARNNLWAGIQIRKAPMPLRPLKMAIATHPAHDNDASVRFCKAIVRQALVAVGAAPARASPVLR